VLHRHIGGPQILLFLDAIVDMRDEQIFMPWNISELVKIEKCYNAVGLPGCSGSVDVVHVKWSNCPSGDYNRAKGKETFPSLGFECITDFNHWILLVYGPHFGSHNDMDIVKTDSYVRSMTKSHLHRDARWSYYGDQGHVRTHRGSYFICNNGYLRWPTTICPFMRVDCSSPEGFFSSNLERVRKDVKCTFGILKKRWRVLNNGFVQREMEVCSKIFITCCWLNNFLVDFMERSTVWVGRGAPLDDDGMWLSGRAEGEGEQADGDASEDEPVAESEDDRELAQAFIQCRGLLVKHLHHLCHKGVISASLQNKINILKSNSKSTSNYLATYSLLSGVVADIGVNCSSGFVICSCSSSPSFMSGNLFTRLTSLCSYASLPILAT
jgi:hypothetical protein